jgi:membrane protein
MQIGRRLEAELSVLGGTFKKARQDSANDLAAAIAFWAFFSIFPLLIGVLSLSSHFLEAESLQKRILEVLTESLPGSAELVMENLEAVVRYRGTMSLVAILGLFWTAGKVFGAMTRAVNRALEIHRDQRALLAKLRYFAMAVSVSALTLIAVGLTIVVDLVLESPALARLGMDTTSFAGSQGWLTSFMVSFLIFSLIYRMTPYKQVVWDQVLPGAFVATLLFELGQAGFVLYLDKVANLKAVYGSLSSIIVLLLWLYVSALVLILGAEYNIVRWQIRNEATET